jgi:hypothetical protein
MKVRTAILTGVAGLMLNAGLGSAVFAQPVYRYRNGMMTQRYYNGNGTWQAERMVRQAYRDILQREPDPSGMQAYTDAMVNRGWSYADVRRALLHSDEYAQRFGVQRYGNARSSRYWRYR